MPTKTGYPVVRAAAYSSVAAALLSPFLTPWPFRLAAWLSIPLPDGYDATVDAAIDGLFALLGAWWATRQVIGPRILLPEQQANGDLRYPSGPPEAPVVADKGRVIGPVIGALLVLILPALAGGQTIRLVPVGASVQEALNAAAPGDTVQLDAGTYSGELKIAKPGITLRGAGRDTVISAPAGSGEAVVTVALSSSLPSPVAVTILEQLTIDAGWQPRRALTVEMYPATARLILRHTRVQRSGRHCIDLRRGERVIIEDSEIAGCLNSDGGRADAHGVVSYVDLEVRRTNISKFSGDAVQMDNSRWRYLRMERVTAFLAPLTADEERNGFDVGIVPGENGLDTKTANPATEKARVEIIGCVFRGFRPGSVRFIANMAALNLKQAIVFDVRDTLIANSEIGFRVRGAGSISNPNLPQQAEGMASNVILDDVDVAFRSEDGLDRFLVTHATLSRIGRAHLVAPASRPVKTTVLNSAFVGVDIPAEWAGEDTNKRVDALGDGYRPLVGSVLIGAADVSVATPTDYYGTPRDIAPDSGAVEAVFDDPDPPIVLDFDAAIGATVLGAGQEQGVILILPASIASAVQAQLGKTVTIRLTVRP